MVKVEPSGTEWISRKWKNAIAVGEVRTGTSTLVRALSQQNYFVRSAPYYNKEPSCKSTSNKGGTEVLDRYFMGERYPDKRLS